MQTFGVLDIFKGLCEIYNMAFESRFWRAEIKRDISFLERKLSNKINFADDVDLDKFFSTVEIKLFTIAYALRKLMETGKFPDRVSAVKLNVSQYNRNQKRIRSWGSFDDYYDLSSQKKIKMELRFLCNQFIHARFFQPVGNSNGFMRVVYFVSDHDQQKCVYSITIKSLLAKTRTIVDLYPKKMNVVYSESEGRDIVTSI